MRCPVKIAAIFAAASVGLAAAATGAGAAEIVLVTTNAMQVGGIAIVGPPPAELQSTLIYASGLATAARQPDAAKAFAKFLAAETAVPAIRKNGMDPA